MSRFRVEHNNSVSSQFVGTTQSRFSQSKPWTVLTNYSYTPPWKYQDVNGCWDELHPGPPYKTGGPFSKFSYDTSEQVLFPYSGPELNNNKLLRYTGSLYVQCPSYAPSYLDSLVNSTNGSESELSGLKSGFDAASYGPTAWSKFKPGKPTAQAFEFLAELDELPRLLHDTSKFYRDSWKAARGQQWHFGPKRIANDWLAANFGWFPFLNDLRKFYKTAKNIDSSIARIRRDNGKWVHKGGSVHADHQENELSYITNGSAIQPNLGPSFLMHSSGAPMYRRITEEVTTNAWFDGSFRYFIPNTDSWQWELSTKAGLFGAFPTPSAIYDLTPWSWLLDWCSNVGDNISNLSNGYAENLVAAYAFVMSKSIHKYKTETSLTWWDGSSTTLENEQTVTWKSRYGASPFGFDLQGGFTPKQISILGALGLQRYL